MPSYPIIYAKKDLLVKNFLEAKTDVSTSNMVEFAIEYYAKTGQYIPLGEVSVTDEHPNKKAHCVYISVGSAAEDYIQQMKLQKISAKKIICDVVSNGVTMSDKTEYITMEHFLIAQRMARTGSLPQGVKKATAYKAHTEREREEGKNTKADNRKLENEANMGLETQAVENISKINTEITISNEKREKKKITFADQFIQNDF